jgi:hypothetical protein
VRIDRELDKIGFLLLSLAQFVIHDFQTALGMDPDRIYPGANVDHSVIDSHRDAREVLLGADENILPVFEALGSVL